ncbi:MAG: hypothetical protein Kow0027_12770 [Saprospiraceae bacterium]
MLALTPIGKITKVHGAQGELKAKVEERFLDALYNAEFVFVKQAGKPVPFFLEDIRGDDNPILKLEEIDSPQDATPLTSQELLLETQLVEQFAEEASGTSSFGYLTGYTLHDQNSGKSGLIKEVLEYPQQEIASVVDDNNSSVLIPLHDELIVEIDDEKKIVEVKLPDGLFEV